MKHFTLLFLFTVLLISSCQKTQSNVSKPDLQNEAHELVYQMAQTVGTYKFLKDKNDVSYTYTYTTPDQKTDISHEKYIFDGELSYGKYTKHERTLQQYDGTIEQGHDGENFWLKHNGKLIREENALKRVAFNRPTNFYWFTMMQKLMDPGLNYEHLGVESIDGKNYDIVKVTFTNQNDKPTDIYQLYINKETHLVDQFLFTVADFGKVETPLLMKLEYEKIDGLLIPSKRKYKESTWDAEVSDKPWINVNWTDIKFNTEIDKELFKKPEYIDTDVNTLKSKLEAKKSNFNQKADDNKKKIYNEGLVSVENSGITSSAKQVGDIAPEFTLNNALNQPVSLNEYLQKGKVILTWYRGGWCPYCNLTLHALQEELPNFKAQGANLIALTPELPDKSISTADKNNLEFEVLSDLHNQIAKQYGIVFKLTDDVAAIYNKSFELNKHNGDESNELPLAATYIIDQNGEIIYSFLDADYRNRAEPSELTEFLKNYKNN